MPKFILKCEHRDYHSDEVEISNTIEFSAETLDNVLDNIEMFLRGSGFVFNGRLDFVNEDDDIKFYDNSIEASEIPESSAWPFPANDRPS